MTSETASRDDYARCREIVSGQDAVVAVAGRLLPREPARAFMAICAWCWRADNLLDNGPQDDLAWMDRQYEQLVADLDDVYAGRSLTAPEARALHDTVHRYEIRKEYFRQFLEGIGMDRRVRRYETFEQLLVYCRAVLSPVTVLATHVLGYRDERTLEYASLMGVAMQLANICRDVGDDCARGRIYLPAEELARFGVTEEDIARGRVTDAFIELMRFQIARARCCYKEAERGIPNIATRRGRFAALTLGRLYALKLSAVERASYDCLTEQPRATAGRRIAEVARALLDVMVMPRSPDLPPAPDPRGFGRDSPPNDDG